MTFFAKNFQNGQSKTPRQASDTKLTVFNSVSKLGRLFNKNKKFWTTSIVAFFIALGAIWLGLSIIILYLAPKLTFDVDKSRNLTYKVPYQTIFLKNKAGDSVDLLKVDNPLSKGLNSLIILYFHGNTGRKPYIIEDSSKLGTVVSPAYPGYSNSSGEPSTDKIYETVDLSMQYLLNQGYQQSNIIVLGHSLGGSAAMYAAQKYPNLQKVVIVNTFYSMQAMCQTKYSILCGLGGDFLNTSKIAPKAKAKIKMFCNIHDDYVPTQQCQKLYAIVGSPDKTLLDISGTHDLFSVATALTME